MAQSLLETDFITFYSDTESCSDSTTPLISPLYMQPLEEHLNGHYVISGSFMILPVERVVVANFTTHYDFPHRYGRGRISFTSSEVDHELLPPVCKGQVYNSELP